MAVRIEILANYRGAAELLQKLCGRTVKSTGDWNWAITDPVHLPFCSHDVRPLPSLSLRVSLDDGDWQMHLYSNGSSILTVNDRETNGLAVARALLQAGLPITSEEELVQALQRRGITETEKRWPLGTLPRVLELLRLSEIFPDWREEIRREETSNEDALPADAPAAAEVAPESDPAALYNGKSGWFREVGSRHVPDNLARATTGHGFELLGIIECSKWKALCFAVFRHRHESVHLVCELEFDITLELLSFTPDEILVTCNHAYPVAGGPVIAQRMPGKSLVECLSKHLDKRSVLGETLTAPTLADFCVLYDRYLASGTDAPLR